MFLKMIRSLALASWLIHPIVALPSGEKDKRADTVTANVYLGNNTGSPNHYASGVLYGIPDTKDQIPSSFYEDMGFCYGRAGGAQVPEPGRGWIWGLTEYENRFASALSNYQSTVEHGGTFIFTIHDLWGADGLQNSSSPYPGDDGDWTSWDDYLDQWISDMEDNDALDNLVVDIWNEPDLGTFWRREQDQYLELWGRTYARLRDAWPDVPLSGPSSASVPSESSEWWVNFMSYVSDNDMAPDQWSWHMESHTHDMDTDHGSLLALQTTYGLPEAQININEYGVADQQVSAGAAWFISQLERHDAYGLRGNWLSGWELHDYLASLLGKPNAGTDDYDKDEAGYYPNGEYQVYKYYALSMTGDRVGTLPSSDTFLDAYATVGDGKLRVLVGVRPSGGEGTWKLALNHLSELGFDTSGSVDIQTYGFPFPGPYDEVDEPTDLGVATHSYSDDVVTFPIYNTDTSRAYAFEIDLP